MFPDQWDACSWSLKQTYIDGMEAEGLFTRGEPGDRQDEESPFSHRKVDSGAQVIDLNEMIRQSRGA